MLLFFINCKVSKYKIITIDKIKRNCALLKRPVASTISSKISGLIEVIKVADQKITIITKNWLPVL